MQALLGGELCAPSSVFALAKKFLPNIALDYEQMNRLLQIVIDSHGEYFPELERVNYSTFHAVDIYASVMYQALVAMAIGLNISGIVATYLPNDELTQLIAHGGKAAVSINKTLIKYLHPDYTPSDLTRHIVGIDEIGEGVDPYVSIIDPYCKEESPYNGLVLPLSHLQQFTDKKDDGLPTWKGMYFATDDTQLIPLLPYEDPKAVYPAVISAKCRQVFLNSSL